MIKAQIRDMTRKDIVGVGEILFEAFNGVARMHGYAEKMGSKQSAESWAWAILYSRSSKPLVAEVDDRLAGVCCLNVRGDFAGVGPVAVHPGLQGYGIGRALMRSLLERANEAKSLRLIQEAFNPASFELYYSLGFMPVADLLELVLVNRGEEALEVSANIRKIDAKHIDAIRTYNLSRSRVDRRVDFEHYSRWGRLLSYESQGTIRGVIACLPGADSVQIGPLVAEGEAEAGCLLEHAINTYPKRCCRTRLMTRDSSVIRAAQRLGFKIYCVDVLMVRGDWRPSEYVEGFGIFPEGV